MDFFFRVTVCITTGDRGIVKIDTERIDGGQEVTHEMANTIADFIARRGVFSDVPVSETEWNGVTAIEWMTECDR